MVYKTIRVMSATGYGEIVKWIKTKSLVLQVKCLINHFLKH